MPKYIIVKPKPTVTISFRVERATKDSLETMIARAKDLGVDVRKQISKGVAAIIKDANIEMDEYVRERGLESGKQSVNGTAATAQS